MVRGLAAIITTNLLYSFATFLPLVILPLYVNRLGASLFVTGLVISFYYVTTTIFSVIWGVLSDAFGKRKIFLPSSLIGGAVVLFITSIVRVPIIVVLLMGAFGFIASAFRPATLAIVGTLASTEERGKYFGFLTASTSLGYAIGSFSGGFVAQYISIPMSVILAAILAVAGAIISLISLRRVDREIINMPVNARLVFSVLKRKFFPTNVNESYVKHGNLHVLFSVTFIRYVSFWGIWTLFAVYMSTILGASDFWVGLLIAINFVLAGAIFQPLAGKLCDIIGRKPMVLIGLVGTSAVEIFYALSPNFLWIIPAQFLLAFTFSCLENGNNCYVTDVTPETQRAEAMGLLTTCIFGGGAVGGLLGGLVAQVVGMQIMFLLMSILPAAGFFIVLIKIKETLIR
jgi:MFS family permease